MHRGEKGAGSFLYPRQLGFGVPLGIESAVHAAGLMCTNWMRATSW